MIKKRLNKEEIENIKKLIHLGSSLKNISKLTHRNKTTIYHYYRKIKGRTVNPVVLNLESEELIGEFMGLFAGDGCSDMTPTHQYRVYLCFNITEKDFVENLIETILIKLFGKKPMIFRQDNRLNLCYYSKDIHQLIEKYLTWDKNFRKTYSVELRGKNYSHEFIIGFIRGCLDSDGHLSQKNISFATVSPGLMKDITESLNKLEIVHSVRIHKDKRANRIPLSTSL